ncbi:hypothetical protein Hdeb2414_s0001g00038201 [Helianthus debilis subsp. tardiflorus]
MGTFFELEQGKLLKKLGDKNSLQSIDLDLMVEESEKSFASPWISCFLHVLATPTP